MIIYQYFIHSSIPYISTEPLLLEVGLELELVSLLLELLESELLDLVLELLSQLVELLEVSLELESEELELSELSEEEELPKNSPYFSFTNSMISRFAMGIGLAVGVTV